MDRLCLLSQQLEVFFAMRAVYFAEVRELVGQGEETLTLPPEVRRVGDLIAWMKARGGGYKLAFAKDNLCCAINQEFAEGNASLEGVNEIAFFPPVSGG